MLILFLVRHAKSSWDHPGLPDFERPLNDRGHRDAPRMARFLQEMGLKPDLFVSSPAKRALSTAQYFAQIFGIPEKDILRDEDIYEASVSNILSVVRRLPESARMVFLFGHNPSLTDVANRFSEDYISNIPTCGVVQLASDADHWAALDPSNTRVVNSFFPKEVL